MKFSDNLERFLAELAKSPRTWMLFGGAIRVADGVGSPQCPLVEECERLGKGRYSNEWADLAGLIIGLSRDESETIQDAADAYPGMSYERALRSRLLEACGLTEVRV